MVSNRWFGAASVLAIIAAVSGLELKTRALHPASAQALPRPISTTKFELKPDAMPKTLVSGPIKVVVEPQKSSDKDSPEYTLNYQIFYNNVPRLKTSVTAWSMGTLELQDLDRNTVPEVVVSTFTGGAHCCTEYTIHGWQQNKFVTTTTGPLDSGGGQFKDLNGDGTLEFLSADNAFLYAFDSYAGSFPPTRIYQYKAGKLINATRQYPKVLRAHAWEMYQAFQRTQKEAEFSRNGVLAGYVGQKILLGEYSQGWDLMLASYDRKSDWGLDIYKGDKAIGKYPNFPAALKAFLIRNGYLDKTGKPIAVDP
jgi:hypothetical protein